MKILVFTLVILLFWGCSKLPESSERVEPLQNVQFEFLQYADKLYFSALVQPTYLNNSLDSVLVFWHGFDSLENPDATIRLNDSGEKGDIIAHDDIYSKKISNTNSDSTNFIPDTSKGMVYMNFVAFYHSQTVTESISIYLENIIPIILSLTAPDTIDRPLGDENEYDLLPVTVSVYDANGFDDIKTVGFTSRHIEPDTLLYNGKLIELYDDGSEVDFCPDFPDYQCTSGDILKNDGIFSRDIPIYGRDSIDPEYQTKTGDFIWTFEVQDMAGKNAEPMIHEVFVR